MAGLRGNTAWLMAQRQAGTVKGGAATLAPATSVKTPFSGGTIGPVKETDNLSETDASRDQGLSYAVSGGVEGTPEFYVRDQGIGFWLYAALGADAPTGTTNFVHAITANPTLPYISAWRNIADTLWEKYTDCKVSTLTIGAEAGAPLTASVAVQGLASTRLTVDPSVAASIPLATGPVYNFNNATVTLGGATTALVRSFELTVENNITRQQTDDFVPYDVVEGLRTVSLSFDLIFENLLEYNKFHYPNVANDGTGVAQTSQLYTTSAAFTFDTQPVSANNSIAFSIPVMSYDEFAVEPDPGGDPIVVSVRATAQRPVTGSIITATVKNQTASY